MRKFLLLLFIASQSIYSQVENFAIQGKNLVWENVYISNEANIPQLVERHSSLKVISQKGNLFKGTGSSVKCSCAEASPLLDNPFNFNFEIELRGDKYRVTLTNFTFSDKSKKTKKATNYFIEKNALKTDENTKNDLSCLNNYFNRIFSMTVYYKNKS